ncbi:MAG: hypothetical protein BWZ02_01299 [Lentisphaerae bacterium ADurb.BinA184]|nr:MAG: hypothetical protein BWZ02_01299 [Lentisphaerae bacterium ADurb.BinA184]
MRARLIDSLQNLYPDCDAARLPVVRAAVDVARGGTIAVHFLVNDVPAGGRVRAAVTTAGGRAVRAARWFQLLDVPVEENTGLHIFTEKAGEVNPYVVRRAPFRTYDAVAPVAFPLACPGGTLALRLVIPVAADERPGPRRYAVTLSCRQATVELGFAAEVHPAVIPAVGRASLPYTNWYSLALMAERHGLKAWSEEHWRMIGRYAQMMVHGRQNTFWIPWPDIFSQGPRGVVLNRERLRRIVKVFTAAGMHFIEGGHVAHRTGGQWESPTFSIVLTNTLATTPEGNADLACACTQLMEEIAQNRWQERWIQHVSDEPTRENAADYRILTGMVRKHMPGLPILDATMDASLAGSVNIWCPQCQEYQKHRELFEAQRALGDKVWFYTCCCPGGPWLNRLLDEELLRPALFGWAAALFRLDGFLHWGLNHYRTDQDPFQKSVVGHGGDNRLPAGDTHIVYPGADGPWSSLRLEAQREGFEDYELLRLLQAKRPALAAKVLARAIRGFDDYTKDPAVFRAARRALLKGLA